MDLWSNMVCVNLPFLRTVKASQPLSLNAVTKNMRRSSLEEEDEEKGEEREAELGLQEKDSAGSRTQGEVMAALWSAQA